MVLVLSLCMRVFVHETDEPGVADVRGHALLPKAEVATVGHHVGVVTINNLHTMQPDQPVISNAMTSRHPP